MKRSDSGYFDEVISRYYRRRNEPFARVGRDLRAIYEPPILRLIEWLNRRLAP